MASAGDAKPQPLAADTHVAVGLDRADERQRRRRPAGADEPSQPDDLARAHRERDVAKTRPAREAAHLEHRRARRRVARRKLLGYVPADHPADELRAIEAGGRRGRHVAAVPQHGHPIGDREDLVEPVRDVDDAQPAIAQLAHDGKKTRDFAAREAR